MIDIQNSEHSLLCLRIVYLHPAVQGLFPFLNDEYKQIYQQE